MHLCGILPNLSRSFSRHSHPISPSHRVELPKPLDSTGETGAFKDDRPGEDPANEKSTARGVEAVEHVQYYMDMCAAIRIDQNGPDSRHDTSTEVIARFSGGEEGGPRTTGESVCGVGRASSARWSQELDCSLAAIISSSPGTRATRRRDRVVISQKICSRSKAKYKLSMHAPRRI